MPVLTLEEIQHDVNHLDEGYLNLLVSNLGGVPLGKIEFVLDFKRFANIKVTIDDHSKLE